LQTPDTYLTCCRGKTLFIKKKNFSKATESLLKFIDFNRLMDVRRHGVARTRRASSNYAMPRRRAISSRVDKTRESKEVGWRA